MAAHDAQRTPPPPPGQAHTPVADVLDQTVAGQTLHHLGNGGRCNREALGDLADGDRLADPCLEKVDRLQVVLDCRGYQRLFHVFLVANLG